MLNLLATTCDDIALANILVIVKRALTLLQIFGPIICIISLLIIFMKSVANPDDKKNTKTITNIVLALVIMLFVPVIVNAVMGIIGDNTNFTSCWKNASDVINNGNGNPDIIDDFDDDDRGTPLIDPSKYEGNKAVPKTEEGTGTDSQKSSSMVFIGDSRVVQTYETLSGKWSNDANYSVGGVHNYDSTVFVAEGGKGIIWLRQTGIPAAKSYFNSGSAVVIMMGVNDITTIDIANTYASYINSNVDNWTANGSKIYFAAVTPCNGNYASLNSSIDNFNSNLKSMLSSKVGWIDVDVYIKSQGYQTTDGLHYNPDTYTKIYNYIKSKV